MAAATLAMLLLEALLHLLTEGLLLACLLVVLQDAASGPASRLPQLRCCL
jgi:hypothetical protein